MNRTPDPIALPADLGRRILELARIAASIHQQDNPITGGTGEEPSTDGAATAQIAATSHGFWRRMLDRIR